ncbi:hypothetical protein GGX14DRAFT_577532 [Mycena pura]|uniref:Uncharacterized protein n=1 Tax=Mycena pura TaxID=153505 RepID=A0AAD6URL4_9AGAR|nr:hypothetical protein GGX14DRAFT_577532 [Mycena pura]
MLLPAASENRSIFEDPYDDLDHSEPESDHSEIGPDPVHSSDSEPDTEPNDASTQPPPMGIRARKILQILIFMEGHDISLANLLDGISWGDKDCTLNAKIRSARTALLNSEELPGPVARRVEGLS